MNIFFPINLSYEPITHVKRNIKLPLPFRRPKISMIRSIADYKVGICPFKVNKCDSITETKHGNFCKNLVCPNFSCCPKNLSRAKFGRAGGGGCFSPPSPNGTYAYGCYHLFFQLNNGVIIMEWIQ